MEKTVKFEEAIDRLAAIVKELESGEVPLDGSIALYEEGMRLSKQCALILEQAEQKIRFLQQNEEEKNNEC